MDELNTCDFFALRGALLKAYITDLVGRCKQSKTACLEEVKKTIMQHKSEDKVEATLSMMVALEDGYELSGVALAVKAQIQRAAALTARIRELEYVGSNIDTNATYSLTRDELVKYGVYKPL